MLVKWKKASALEFTGQWQGMNLQIMWLPTEHVWRVWVEGHRTKEKFTSVAAAIDQVEYLLGKQLLAQAANVKAVQRPMSAGRAVHCATA